MRSLCIDTGTYVFSLNLPNAIISLGHIDVLKEKKMGDS